MWAVTIVERDGFRQTYQMRRRDAESLFAQLMDISGPNVERIQILNPHGDITWEYATYGHCECDKCRHDIAENDHNV